jgi:hypothetical protein
MFPEQVHIPPFDLEDVAFVVPAFPIVALASHEYPASLLSAANPLWKWTLHPPSGWLHCRQFCEPSLSGSRSSHLH